jgi:hypothetical protein
MSKQKPVAYAHFTDKGAIRMWSATQCDNIKTLAAQIGTDPVPLYTAPREWVGLEDVDVYTVKNEFNRGALWAEQILKEKNL